MRSYINFFAKYSKSILFAMLIATGIFGYYAQFLSIDASAETLLLENDPDLKLNREVHNRYGNSDYLIVAFSPKEFLLSDSTISTIKNLKSSLQSIDGVESITTILDVPLLESPTKSIQDIVVDTKTLLSPNIDKKLVQKELTSSPLYAKNLVSSDFKTTAIMINLKEDANYTKLLSERNKFIELKQTRKLSKKENAQFEKAKQELKDYRDHLRVKEHDMIVQVRSTIDQFRDKGDLFLGGAIMIADDMIGFVKSDIVIYGIAILLVIILMLWVIFRQVRFIVIPIVISIVALIISTAINALAGLEVTVVSSNYVAMQLITTLSLVIHLIVSYREQYGLYPDHSQKELLEITLKRMYIPSVFVILTSVAGFASLMLGDILPIVDLGIMMNIGVSVTLIVAYILFPAMMMLYQKKDPVMTFDKAFKLNNVFANIVEKDGKAILVIIIAIFAFSAYGVSKLMVENSFINYFKKSTEIYKGMEKIDNNLGGTTPLEIILKFPKNDVNNSTTNTKTSKELDSFEDEFAQFENEAQYWFTPDKMQAIMKVHNYLESLPEIGNVSSLGTLLKVGQRLKNGHDLDNFDLALMYNHLSPEYKKILLSPYVSIDNNEVRFVVRIIDSNPNLRRDELLKKIKTELNTKVGLDPKEYKLAGMMVLYNNMLQSLFDSQISTLGLALLLLGSMFLFLFRSIKIAILAMMVNLVPISVVFGIMGSANIPLDMMSITIASIALGITVDNTIHYYYRFREEVAIDGDYIASMHRAHSTIAFGMFYYSIATIIGFLVLVTSNFIPTLIFGLLTVIALLVAIVSDLLFSPLLVVIFKPFGPGKKIIK
ncbi:MAG: MMPL family transporter [Sulfurovaceae bacterium]|nr:MMPL family transporter [Sulfurovaceae bacterium]